MEKEQKELMTKKMNELNLFGIQQMSNAFFVLEIVNTLLMFIGYGFRLTWQYYALAFSGIAISLTGKLLPKYIRKQVKKHDEPLLINFYMEIIYTLYLLWSGCAGIFAYAHKQHIIVFLIMTTALSGMMIHDKKTGVCISVLSLLLFYLILCRNYGFANILHNVPFMNYAGFMGAEYILSQTRYNELRKTLEQKNEIERERTELLEQTKRDSLFDIKSRFCFEDDIPSFIGKDICVMNVDINYFKTINDNYGHEIGDQAIINVGKVLINNYSYDSCYRIGGDEFIVVKNGNEINTDKFEKELANININGMDIPVKCSFGIIKGHPENAEDFNDIMKNADRIMYENKKAAHHKDENTEMTDQEEVCL